jgi:hypothetical protein
VLQYSYAQIEFYGNREVNARYFVRDTATRLSRVLQSVRKAGSSPPFNLLLRIWLKRYCITKFGTNIPHNFTLRLTAIAIAFAKKTLRASMCMVRWRPTGGKVTMQFAYRERDS